MTRMGPNPSMRLTEPKVKRLTPEMGSLPTVASIRPSTPGISPFSSEPSDREAITLSPRMPTAK